MKYYRVEPEVAGGFGEGTVMKDPGERPLNVEKFEYQFNGWLGDDILETVGCFIGTKRLVEAVQKIHPTGVEFGIVEVTKSFEFEELFPNKQLPEFLWLKINGKARSDDFSVGSDNRLIVSEQVLKVLNDLNISHARVTEL